MTNKKNKSVLSGLVVTNSNDGPFCTKGGRKPCECQLGVGGETCNFNIKSVYGDHDPYKGYVPREDSDLSGWNYNESMVAFRHIMHNKPIRLLVEVGVWRGASAVLFAKDLQKRGGGGAVLCVDTFLGAPEFWMKKAEDSSRDLEFKHGLPQVYDTFLSNVVREKVSDVVIPFPSTSSLAAHHVAAHKAKADFVHIDAAHEYDEIIKDILKWWPLVADGGCLMGDDYHWFWKGVRKAVDEWAENSLLKFRKYKWKWWVCRGDLRRPDEPWKIEKVPLWKLEGQVEGEFKT